jgi:hypothetical protein
MRVGLVGCVKSKQEVAAPAGDLYTSPLFLGRRAAVEASCDRWFILSAQHGLLDPAEVLEPYDLTLSSLPVAERRRWSTNVVAALRDELGDLSQHAFEVHAGAAYTGHGLVDELRRARAVVKLPLAGLSLGQQLAHYADRKPGARASRRDTLAQGASSGPSLSPPRARYEALYRHLSGISEDVVTLSFAEVEAILGHTLPPSASRYRAWWSNGSHSHSRAWLDAGYEVDDVHRGSGTVRFRRTR